MQLPKIVAARLKGSILPEHPDPDLLTAFAEGTLLSRERERVLGHLGRCAECRQILVLAAPEMTEDALHAEVSGRTSWLRTPALRWGALAACVVVVATAVLIHKGERASRMEETEIAMRRSPVPAAPAFQLPKESEQAAAIPPSTKAKTRKPPVPATKSLPQELESSRAAQSLGANAPASPSSNTVDAMQKSESVEVEAGAVAAEPSAGYKADQQLRARNSVAAAKAAPAFMARPTTETAASTIGSAAKFNDLRAPSWRLSEEGLPERSFSSGQWEKVQVDHKQGFRALASQGMEVWVGGPAGLLYHSVDMGLNWSRVIPVSASSTLTDDITSIAFTDHLHGRITTAAGQTWVTSDAGKTWETQ